MEPTAPLVSDDWKRNDEGVPVALAAPTSIRIARNALRYLLGISVLFFSGSVLFFTYYFFIGPGSVPAPPSNIDIAIGGPLQITSGQASELQIVVTNRNPVPLESTDLVLTYPSGTRSPTDYATDLQSQRISLGTIAPGGQRQGTVTAVFSGNEGKAEHVKVELEYRIAGANAIFVATNDYGFTYSTSPLSVTVEGNTQVIAGQPVEFIATVASNSSAPIKDALLSVKYPFGFKFKSSIPSQSADGLWELGDLPAGAKRTIVINGTLEGAAADERVFNFSVGTRRTPDEKQLDFAYSTLPYRVAISKPFLGLTLATNKNSSSTVTVAAGENINIAIIWENNLPTAITDAVIVAKLSGMEIDGATVRSTDGFYRSADTTVIWDKTTSNGALKLLPPGSYGTVGFSFQMPPGSKLSSLAAPYLNVSVNASGNRVSETGVPENLQSTVQQKIALASSLQFVAQGLYYQSPFGGTGPMPPEAGKETSYAIFFTVNNTINRIKGATVTAILPPYVRFAGHWVPKDENVRFNPVNNTMTWNLDTIEPGVGLNGKESRKMAIEIAFTPSTSQIGEQPALLQDIVLTGTDEATNRVLTVEIPNVTTNLALPAKSSKDVTIGSDKGFTPLNATVKKAE